MSTNQWKQMPNVPTKVKYHGLVMDAFDRIYCFGGKPNGKQMHCFDTHTNKWIRCPDIPIDTCSFGAIMDTNNRFLLILGGSDTVQPNSGSMWSHVYVYDTFTGVWKKSDHAMPYGVKDTQVCMKGKVCHVFGGSNGSPMDKHVVGTANVELPDDMNMMDEKNKDELIFYKLSDDTKASDDMIKLVEDNCKFDVEYDEKKTVDGVANIKWTPYVKGKYLIDIFMDGQAIKDSPYPIDVQPLMNYVMDMDDKNEKKEQEKLCNIISSFVDKNMNGNENRFKMPKKVLFVYDCDKYDMEFIQYVHGLSYEWQKHLTLDQMSACDMPDHYKPSLSTGIYGFYNVKKVDVKCVDEVKEEKQIEMKQQQQQEEKKYENDDFEYLEPIPMVNTYKPSKSTGIYGIYSLNDVPLAYKPSYCTGIYGTYMINNDYINNINDEIKREIEYESDGSSTEQEDEDTFNNLFKHIETHSVHKKNKKHDEEIQEIDDDIAVAFGVTKKTAVFPKKLMINGNRVRVESGPGYNGHVLDEEKKNEDKKEKETEEKVMRSSITTDASYKAMKCVFLSYIKHLGFDELLYKWSRNQMVDKQMIECIGSIWKYARFITCDILRERQDFEKRKVEIKSKYDMENKDKKIKEILKEFEKKRQEERKGNDEEKKDENKENENEKKIYKGNCKEFDVEKGVGIITIENEKNEEKDEQMNEIKVDKAEIFAYDNKQTLLVGEPLEFQVIEKDGVKIAICCTGINGQYVKGIVDENDKKEEEKKECDDDNDNDFDGFERGYIHLYKQSKVLMNIRNKNTKINNVKTVLDISDFDEVNVCKWINAILNLNESIEFEQVLVLVRDRSKIALQKQTAYNMFTKLFKSNNISLQFYLLVLWYFYRSLQAFSFPTASVYRNKPEIFNEKLSDNMKQYKYRLSNEFFNAHYLSELDGVNVNIIHKLKQTFWNIFNNAIHKMEKNKNKNKNIQLMQMIINICAMDWRKHDLQLFKRKYKQTLIEYLLELSPIKINKTKIKNEEEKKDDEKKSETESEAHFWNDDIFGKYVFDIEIQRRKDLLPKQENDIIRQELDSLTWIGKTDMNEKLFVQNVDNKNMKLNVNTLKIISDEKENEFKYKLSGNGTSPLISNGIKFEGEYNPFAENKKENVNLLISCASDELKIDVASWSANDPVKDGFNKSHIRINDGDNQQTTNYGLHFALVNLFNGSVLKYKYFDIHSSESNVQLLIDYVADLPLHHLIIITTYYNSGKHWKESIYDALKVYGWTWKKVEEYESFIFVANTDGQTVYYHQKRMKNYGPLQKELFIPFYPQPNIQFNGCFTENNIINGKWNFVNLNTIANEVWINYIKKQNELEFEKIKCGVIDFTVCKELEDGWKWKQEEADKKDEIKNSTDEIKFYSYLRIPFDKNTKVEVSSNKNTLKQMIDDNLETYWQSGSSNKKHWISFSFSEYACFSGCAMYLDFRKDSSYTPEKLNLYIGQENKQDIDCIVTQCVQREFKGIYSINMKANACIKCKYVKIEWINEVQAKYARIRQIYLYSREINQIENKKINECLIQENKLLMNNIWKCTDLIDEIEKEYDDKWMKNNSIQSNKEKERITATSTDNDSKANVNIINKKDDVIDDDLFTDDDDESYSDDDW